MDWHVTDDDEGGFLCRWAPKHAHHAGPRPGVGMKCSDYLTHCFCDYHHRMWHTGRGPFRGWTREQRRMWADAQIAATQSQLKHLIKERADV